MRLEKIAAMIAASPKREAIEAALKAVYGTHDVAAITADSLDTFIKLVIPAIDPNFGKEARDND